MLGFESSGFQKKIHLQMPRQQNRFKKLLTQGFEWQISSQGSTDLAHAYMGFLIVSEYIHSFRKIPGNPY
jgi:hypothetical protein